MASHLHNQTNTLESTTPVPPSQARTAQIPLQSFTLPTFPPEAFSTATNLSALILTSDVKLDEYSSELEKPYEIPDLPAGIKTLTLELFSLGFPSGWLVALGEKLRGLKALTLYSQLFAGTTTASREDALMFIEKQKELRELHLLDVFLPKGFLTEFKGKSGGDVRFLEVSYTFRHSDPEFLGALNAREILGVVEGRKGMLGLSVRVESPDVRVEDEDDREGTEEGVLVVGGLGERVVDVLKEGGGELRLCDLTMFELRIGEVGSLLEVCKEIRVLSVSVGLEKGWKEVFDGLGAKEREIEVLELVGVPGKEVVEAMKEEGGFRKEDVEELGRSWKGLKSIKGSILRTKGEEWLKEGEEHHGQAAYYSSATVRVNNIVRISPRMICVRLLQTHSKKQHYQACTSYIGIRKLDNGTKAALYKANESSTEWYNPKTQASGVDWLATSGGGATLICLKGPQ
ncbi:uncharacterized protein LY89DRAFT_726096 [Mollisia scopiformis]|uniref:Uncharacterized protein n=1 Tax=Mollisia scopiformis TaxID=149040 RepID=A0A132B400_MOLSC|nr:uncharacterized protein LY89DRAFT_726096 [Mollisia scopiformis]KUJ06963.1 hypothetical protein LY89DRAFT_726096 [Mollisia scopiformis]